MSEEIKWKAMAGQLKRPEGQAGIDTGKQMEQTNAFMISRTIDLLEIHENDKTLEIGFGNGSHVGNLLAKAAGIQYTGIDISETMVEQALIANAQAVEQKKVFFVLSDGETISFSDNTFDRIFTVNTIYFWKDPKAYAKEIYRVLKSGGTCCITFAHEDFMQQLPFVQYGFTLYAPSAVSELMTAAGLVVETGSIENETVKTNAGEEVKRTFSVAAFSKHL